MNQDEWKSATYRTSPYERVKPGEESILPFKVHCDCGKEFWSLTTLGRHMEDDCIVMAAEALLR